MSGLISDQKQQFHVQTSKDTQQRDVAQRHHLRRTCVDLAGCLFIHDIICNSDDPLREADYECFYW